MQCFLNTKFTEKVKEKIKKKKKMGAKVLTIFILLITIIFSW